MRISFVAMATLQVVASAALAAVALDACAAQSAAGRPLDIAPGVARNAVQPRTAPARPARARPKAPALAAATGGLGGSEPVLPVVAPVLGAAPAAATPGARAPAPPASLSPSAADRPAPESATAPVPAAAQAKPPESPLAQAYCANIVDAAAQARAAWQARQLLNLQDQLERRIAELEAKKAEYQKWVEKQEELRKKADQGLVAIFSRMRPDSAASQIAAMEEPSAAALLAKLNPRSASAILNEMSAAKAARLADAMTGNASAERMP